MSTTNTLQEISQRSKITKCQDTTSKICLRTHLSLMYHQSTTVLIVLKPRKSENYAVLSRKLYCLLTTNERSISGILLESLNSEISGTQLEIIFQCNIGQWSWRNISRWIDWESNLTGRRFKSQLKRSSVYLLCFKVQLKLKLKED